MSLPRYPAYKDSGAEWLGEVPVGWVVSALKHRARLRYGDALAADIREPGGVTVYGSNGAVGVHAAANTAAPAIVVGRKGSFGKVVWAEAGGFVIDTAYAIDVDLCAEELRWAYYVLGAAGLDALSQDTGVPGLAREVAHSLRVATPPRPEQAHIAAFLDRETAKIDALVAEQERLIELLKEKRQAVISHAVTKGLNPDAPMKDSGIEWLGEVPAHWTCARNKVVFQEVDHRAETDAGELLTVSHITGVTPRSEKNVNMILAETLEGYKTCHPGDLVINTMWAWMGALGCSPCVGVVSPSYNVYRPRDGGRILPDYYDFLCRIPSHVAAMTANSKGIWESRLRLYPDAFLNMRLALPPPSEQAAITRFLDSVTGRFDTLTAEAQRAIDLLQERRTALISAAVTGQIDVRPAGERIST
jgi:type I restriction enzyme S subunit